MDEFRFFATTAAVTAFSLLTGCATAPPVDKARLASVHAIFFDVLWNRLTVRSGKKPGDHPASYWGARTSRRTPATPSVQL
jgi:hypothetical protein